MSYIRESDIERKVCAYAEGKGMLTIKQATGKGYPDRLILYEGKAVFIEFKRPNAKPRALQQHKMKRLQQVGFDSYVIDNVNDGKQLIDELLISVSRENKSRQ